jgi:hypothetical protein
MELPGSVVRTFFLEKTEFNRSRENPICYETVPPHFASHGGRTRKTISAAGACRASLSLNPLSDTVALVKAVSQGSN